MWEFLLFFCWKGKSLEVAQLHWNLDDRNQDCSLGECIYVVWCSSSLKSKTVWLQRYEDVNLVFWCLWNGGHHNTSRWGNFSYSQQKADGHRASDLQFKFVSLCVCVCLWKWAQSTHCVCLCEWTVYTLQRACDWLWMPCPFCTEGSN